MKIRALLSLAVMLPVMMCSCGRVEHTEPGVDTEAAVTVSQTEETAAEIASTHETRSTASTAAATVPSETISLSVSVSKTSETASEASSTKTSKSLTEAAATATSASTSKKTAFSVTTTQTSASASKKAAASKATTTSETASKTAAATTLPTTAAKSETSKATSQKPAVTDPYKGKTAEEILELMTLEEKVGQLFIVRPEALGGSKEKFDSAKQTGIDRYHVGGVCMFAENITDPGQIKKYISSLQSASEIPMFISIDEEGGRVARIANNGSFKVTKFKSMQSVGASGDASKAHNVGSVIGGYLKEYGFNVDLAPVADVNTNPSNIVIGDRAFGSDPKLVSKMVKSAVEGFHSKGMITCVKHFPGHGDTYGDTHNESVSVKKTWAQLKSCELIPFIGAIDAGTDMIMVAHINTPNVTDDGMPASLSKQMIDGKLRGELGFDGVVITDALGMKAITSKYGSGQSAVLAVNAGVDILLIPEDLDKAYNSVIEAVKSGEISQERLDESVLRILTLKQKYGII